MAKESRKFWAIAATGARGVCGMQVQARHPCLCLVIHEKSWEDLMCVATHVQ